MHNAWTYAMGDEKQIRKVADDLEKCNKKLAEHYALHTDLTVDEALELMTAETTISVDEAVFLRFATEKEEVFRPLALKRITNNNYKQTNNTMKNQISRMALNLIAESKKLVGIKAKKVMTAEEIEVDFVDLAEDAVIEVEDYATVDGVAASGEYLMKSKETYVFEAGYLKEIKEATEEEEENEEDVNASTQALMDTIALLNAKISEQNTKLAKFENAKSPGADVTPKGSKGKGDEKQKDEPNRAAAAIQKMNELKNKK